MNDIHIVQGESVDIMVTVKDQRGEIVNIEGFEGVFGCTILGFKPMSVIDNKLILSLTPQETLAMTPKEYRYEVKVRTPERKIKSILSGSLIIAKGFVQFQE